MKILSPSGCLELLPPLIGQTPLQVQSLKNDEEKQRTVVAATLAATPQKLYSQDLDDFIAALEDYEARELKQLNALGERQRRALSKGKGKAKKVG